SSPTTSTSSRTRPGVMPKRCCADGVPLGSKMRSSCPAAVHVDGTARPQLIRRELNPECYAILSEYEKLSGIPCLINTSFNMHEEPIVCSPHDAVRAFLLGHLDGLAIGPF